MKYLKLFESENIPRDLYDKISPVIDEYKYIIEDEGGINIEIYSPSSERSWFYGKCFVTLIRVNKNTDTDKFRKSPEFLEFVDRISEDLPEYIVDSSRSDKPVYPGGGFSGCDGMGNIRIEIRKRHPWEFPKVKRKYVRKLNESIEKDFKKIIEEIKFISYVMEDEGYPIKVSYFIESPKSWFDGGRCCTKGPFIEASLQAFPHGYPSFFSEWIDRCREIAENNNCKFVEQFPGHIFQIY